MSDTPTHYRFHNPDGASVVLWIDDLSLVHLSDDAPEGRGVDVHNPLCMRGTNGLVYALTCEPGSYRPDVIRCNLVDVTDLLVEYFMLHGEDGTHYRFFVSASAEHPDEPGLACESLEGDIRAST